MLFEKVGNAAFHPCIGYSLEYDCWVSLDASISGLNDATFGLQFVSSLFPFLKIGKI